MKSTITENGLIIERVFDAPREKVWEAIANQEKFTKWWGQPEEGSMPYAKMDFREGGFIHFKVEFGDTVVWGKSIFQEIVEQERLVIDDYFSDEQGTLLDTADYPKSQITLELEDLAGKTKLTVTHEGIGKGRHTAEEYQGGWEGSLNKLEATLKS